MAQTVLGAKQLGTGRSGEAGGGGGAGIFSHPLPDSSARVQSHHEPSFSWVVMPIQKAAPRPLQSLTTEATPPA